MTEAVVLWEKPEADELSMIAGWRQWADAGSISSGLPKYLVQQTGAHKIGEIRADGFYLFQIPGTHHLVRPVVQFSQGLPQGIEAQRNELFYAGDGQRGVVFFVGDEPHMDAERYVASFLKAAEMLNVRRIVSFGGVYGELPYEKERMVSAIYSLASMEEAVQELAVNLSDYQGGASIGSFVCTRSRELEQEYLGFYAFVPTYDFSNIAEIGNMIRIENDYMAWLGVMRRVNHYLKTTFDLSDLEQKSAQLIRVVDDKIDELERMVPQSGVRDYMAGLTDAFNEVSFEPLDQIWQDELSRLFDDDEPEQG